MNKNINKSNIKKDNSNPNKEILFTSNPKYLSFFTNIITDCYYNYFDNTFCIFNSINKILCLIYLIKNDKINSIVCFNILENKKMIEIRKAHSELITNLRHYLDELNKRDLMISISSKNNNIKLWNINTFECILNLENINKKGLLFSACFFKEENKIYLISGNYLYGDPEQIKVYDINNSNKIKEISDSKENVVFIDTYYDKKDGINYIVSANKGNIKSYNYKENKPYHIYDNKDNRNHNSLIVTENEGIIKLNESSATGRIRIWNFHTGNIIATIMIYRYGEIYGLCIWNSEFLVAGCSDKKIKIVNFNRKRIYNELSGHNNDVLTVKKIIHPKYGECLISNSDEIKLWKINK